jgi:hypothetical protein
MNYSLLFTENLFICFLHRATDVRSSAPIAGDDNRRFLTFSRDGADYVAALDANQHVAVVRLKDPLISI